MQQEQKQSSATAPQTAQEVLATLGYPGFVKALFNRSGQIPVDFTHAVLGISTEIDELAAASTQINAIEEAGDLAFYLEAFNQVVRDAFPEATFAASPQDELADYAEMLALYPELDNTPSYWATQRGNVLLQDVAKRWIGYGRAPTVSPRLLIALATYVVNTAAHAHLALLAVGGNMIIEVNVAKLLERYKKVKFDADLAINRDHAAELVVMSDTQLLA